MKTLRDFWDEQRAARIARQNCPRGGLHEWEEFAGMGGAGFESGWYCVKCEARKP